MNLKICIVSCMLVIGILTDPCTTPNNEQAECISLFACPILINSIATLNSGSIEFVSRSICGNSTAKRPMACCGSFSNFTSAKHSSWEPDRNIHLLPAMASCGLEHAQKYYPTKNKTAGMDEFPWAARLLYTITIKGIKQTRCSGSLINTRYVLTLASCIHSFGSNLTGIRLGYYHVKNDIDCRQDECTDDFEEIGIEKIIQHPGFYSDLRHNIALLRLNRSVTYSDYIRPICLHLPRTTTAKVGDTVITFVWDKDNSTGDVGEVRKQIRNRLISGEECAAAFQFNSIEIIERFDNEKICTMEIDDIPESTRLGDIGGPIMFLDNYQWYLEGLTSIYNFEIFSNTPKWHTRVNYYVYWILDNLEP